MLGRPEVTPDNYAQFYPWYEERSSNALVMTALHRANRMLYWPITEEEDGAIKKIGELAQEGYRIIYSCNHETMFDQDAVDGELQRHPALRETTEKIFVPAKLDYFQGIQRLFFDATYSIPVVRKKDVNDQIELTLDPARRFQQFAVKKIIEGYNMLIFYGGGRSDKSSRDTVAEVMSGTAFIANRASKRVPVAIASIGLRTGSNYPKGLNWARPYLYFCTPQISPPDGPFENKMDVFDGLKFNSAKALQRVIEIANTR